MKPIFETCQPLPRYWRSRCSQVAEGYPERLADGPESDTQSNLATATGLTISHRYDGDEPGEWVGTVARLLGAEQGRADRGSDAPPQRVAQRGRATRREGSRGRGRGDRTLTEKTISNVTAMSGRMMEVVREVL